MEIVSPHVAPPLHDLTTAGLIHDLNNVFETISEAAELLATDPKWSSLAATIQRSVDGGQRIVESIGGDRETLLDLASLVGNAMQFTQDFLTAVHRPKIDFVPLLEPGLRMKSGFALERVLVNLFLNAAQAMPRGGRVEIRARQIAGDVEIEVSDEGPGIAPEILAEIFKPHFSTKSPRSGLGLHIVATIMRENSGTVSAANRTESHGAVFTIVLPV